MSQKLLILNIKNHLFLILLPVGRVPGTRIRAAEQPVCIYFLYLTPWVFVELDINPIGMFRLYLFSSIVIFRSLVISARKYWSFA